MNQPTFINTSLVRTDEMLTMIRTVLVRMLLTTLAAALLGSGVGYLIAQLPGVWAALIASGLGLFFTATTVALIYLVVGRGPELLQIVLLGGWLIKMAVVLVLILWLRTMDFYHRGTFVGVLILLAVALLVVELYTVLTTRLPIIDLAATAREPGSADQHEAPSPAPDGRQDEARHDDAPSGHDSKDDPVG